jgi:hypothetical protein
MINFTLLEFLVRLVPEPGLALDGWLMLRSPLKKDSKVSFQVYSI